jgi:hypothetical protein
MLSRHVTADNHVALLAAASGKGKRAVEELLVGLFPGGGETGQGAADPLAGRECQSRGDLGRLRPGDTGPRWG